MTAIRAQASSSQSPSMQSPPAQPQAHGREELQAGQQVSIPSATPGYESTHIAMPGDSWQSLAERWSVNEQALRRANIPTKDPGENTRGEPSADSQEGIGAFMRGAIAGDLGNDSSWSSTAGQVAAGFIPIAGQAADLRDTAAAIKKVWNGEEGGWLALGASVVGWAPGIGDAAKAALRGGDKVADAVQQTGQHALRQGDELAQGATRKADEALPPSPGARRLPGESPADAAQRLDGDIAHARATGGKPEVIEQWERRRADNLADARKEAAQLEGAVPGRLLPNHSYQLNGYTYATDAKGRIKTVEGELRLDPAPRNSAAQAKVGEGDGRLSFDQGGHLIGAQFGGYRGVENLTPMHQDINNYHSGKWGSMERRWANALREGKSVHVKIDLKYDNDTMRASQFRVTESVDGNAKKSIIENPSK